MFDILFETSAYRNLYVISDSEMKELQRTQNQDELEEAYQAHVNHLDE